MESQLIEITTFKESHLDAIVELSLRAWAPVFESLKSVMDPEIFMLQHPDWRVTQKDAVIAACTDKDLKTFVAVLKGKVVGFAVVNLHQDDLMGEVYMIAIDPNYQNQGIATKLMDTAAEFAKEKGMTNMMVATGGDPGHASARALYESLDYSPLPSVYYFKKL